MTFYKILPLCLVAMPLFVLAGESPDQAEAGSLLAEAKRTLYRSTYDDPKVTVSRRLRELGVHAELKPARTAIHNAWQQGNWNELSRLVSCGDVLRSRDQIDCILRALDNNPCYLTLTDAVARPKLTETYEFYVVQIDKTPLGPCARPDPELPKWQIHPDGHGFIRKIANFPEYERQFVVLLVTVSEKPLINQTVNPFPPGARYGQNDSLRDVEMRKIDQRKELGLLSNDETVAAKVQINQKLTESALALIEKY
jgi:hypothetical protein